MVLQIICALLVVIIFVLLVGIREKSTNSICLSKRRLEGRTVVVTGGTAGMGLELARDLAQRGARVIIACPWQQEGAAALTTLRASCPDNPHIYFELLDLASFHSTRSFAQRIIANEPRLDILINNAGVGAPHNIKTGDGLNFVMQVNYYGAFLLTLLLLPLLKKSGSSAEPSRIVTVSSIFHYVGMVNFNDTFRWLIFPPYANSKFCVVLFSRELTKRLKGSNVVINNSDPGLVGTTIFLAIHRIIGSIVSYLFWVLFKNPWQGMQTALHVALDEKAGKVSGEYFKNCRLTRAVGRAYDDKLAMKLWEESIRLVKLTHQELEECFKPLNLQDKSGN